MMTNRLIEKLSVHPKILFVVDGLGAGLTAIMLGTVLVKFERFFGIPSATLYILAMIPIAFIIYDVYCYAQVDKKVALCLKGIAVMNVLLRITRICHLS